VYLGVALILFWGLLALALQLRTLYISMLPPSSGKSPTGRATTTHPNPPEV